MITGNGKMHEVQTFVLTVYWQCLPFQMCEDSPNFRALLMWHIHLWYASIITQPISSLWPLVDTHSMSPKLSKKSPTNSLDLCTNQILMERKRPKQIKFRPNKICKNIISCPIIMIIFWVKSQQRVRHIFSSLTNVRKVRSRRKVQWLCGFPMIIWLRLLVRL